MTTPGVALFSDVTLTDFRIMVENSSTKWSKDMTGFDHVTGYYSLSGEQTSWEAAMGPGWVEEPTSKVIKTGLVAAGIVGATIPKEPAVKEVVAEENYAEETVHNTPPKAAAELSVNELSAERALIRGGCIRTATHAILQGALANCRTQQSVIESTLIQLCGRITMAEELVEARNQELYSEEVLLQSSGLLMMILEPFLTPLG